MISAIKTILNRILTDHPPKSLLCVGQDIRNAMSEFLVQHPDCHLIEKDIINTNAQQAIQSLDTKGSFEFGIVSNTIEHLDKATAEHVLARLRDIHTKKLLIVVPIGKLWKNHVSYWEETDLLALGFILKANMTIDKKPVHVYAFDIATYKTTPDWLNNKYWANPQLWDKHWW